MLNAAKWNLGKVKIKQMLFSGHFNMRGVPGALSYILCVVLLCLYCLIACCFFFRDFLRSSASFFDSSFLRQLSSTRGRIVGKEFDKRFFLVSFEPFYGLLLVTV